MKIFLEYRRINQQACLLDEGHPWTPWTKVLALVLYLFSGIVQRIKPSVVCLSPRMCRIIIPSDCVSEGTDIALVFAYTLARSCTVSVKNCRCGRNRLGVHYYILQSGSIKPLDTISVNIFWLGGISLLDMKAST